MVIQPEGWAHDQLSPNYSFVCYKKTQQALNCERFFGHSSLEQSKSAEGMESSEKENIQLGERVLTRHVQ
jgi:hypothetical protein